MERMNERKNEYLYGRTEEEVEGKRRRIAPEDENEEAGHEESWEGSAR